MNRLIISLCVSAIILNVAGCKHEPTTYTVCLLDVSKSITPNGVQDEFAAMDDLVNRMHRGDRLTVIPITGSAISELPGHVLYFVAPLDREPYDHDLAVFRQQTHERIAALREIAIAHPTNRTNILGALEVAKQAFDESQEDLEEGTKRTLIVSSDLIEDDGVYRFAFDPAFSSHARARALAERLKKENGFELDGVRIHFSILESTDLRSMNPLRQKAIRAFWADYLALSSIDRTSKSVF